MIEEKSGNLFPIPTSSTYFSIINHVSGYPLSAALRKNNYFGKFMYICQCLQRTHPMWLGVMKLMNEMKEKLGLIKKSILSHQTWYYQKLFPTYKLQYFGDI